MSTVFWQSADTFPDDYDDDDDDDDVIWSSDAYNQSLRKVSGTARQNYQTPQHQACKYK